MEAFPSDQIRGQFHYFIDNTCTRDPMSWGLEGHQSAHLFSRPQEYQAPMLQALFSFATLNTPSSTQASIPLHLHGPKRPLSPSSARCNKSPFKGNTVFLNSKSPLSRWPASPCFISTHSDGPGSRHRGFLRTLSEAVAFSMSPFNSL